MLTETHMEVSRELILHAEEQLALGNSLQASEKGWGAAAHAVKAVAEHQGWRHRSHRDLFTAARRIATMTDRPGIIELFGAANALHVNYYEGWLDDEYISMSLNSVKRFLDMLTPIVTDDRVNGDFQ